MHYQLDLKTGTLVELAPVTNPAPVTKEWHKGDHPETFGSYPADGECSCGMHKHHVHCGACGGVTQVG